MCVGWGRDGEGEVGKGRKTYVCVRRRGVKNAPVWCHYMYYGYNEEVILESGAGHSLWFTLSIRYL